MTDLVWRDEVVQQQALDYTNDLASKVRFALLPDSTGVNLDDLSSGISYTSPSPFTLNGDGSITKDDTNTAGVTTNNIGNPNGKELIAVIDLKRGGNNSNQEHTLIEFNGGGTDYVHIKTASYSSGAIIVRSVLNNSTSNSQLNMGSSRDRDIYLVHYKVGEGVVDIYADGVLQQSITGRAVNPFGEDVYINTGIASSKDKFYSSTVLQADRFTSEQIQSVMDDPYQIFQTNVATRKANSVFLNGYNSGMKIDSSFNIPKAANLRMDICITPIYQNDNYMTSMGFSTSQGAYSIGFRKDKTIYIQAKNSTGTGIDTAKYEYNKKIVLSIRREGQPSADTWDGWNFYLDGVLVATKNQPHFDITGFFFRTQRDNYECKYRLHWVRYSDSNGVNSAFDFDMEEPEDGRVYDLYDNSRYLELLSFPISHGVTDKGYVASTERATLSQPIVVEGDFNIKLNIAPASGAFDTYLYGEHTTGGKFSYSRQSNNNMTLVVNDITNQVGRFSRTHGVFYDYEISRVGTTITHKMTDTDGNVSGYAEKLDQSDLPIQIDKLFDFAASSNKRIVNNIFIEEVSTGTTYEYDFTKGNDLLIPEVGGYNSVRISQTQPKNFSPSAEYLDYTLGDGKDFSTIREFSQFVDNPEFIHRATIYGQLPDSGSIIFNQYTEIELHAGDNPFNGQDYNTNWHIYGAYLRGGGSWKVRVYGIRGNNLLFGTYGGVDSVELYSCFIHVPSNNNVFPNGNFRWLIKDSVVGGARSRISGVTEPTDATILNSIIYSMGGYATSYGLSNVNLQNCLVFQGSGAYNQNIPMIGLNCTGNNNVSLDTSAVDAGVGIQDVNLLSYFQDEATQNFLINQAGQDALKGKGWNGTDIVSWAYADLAEVGSIQITSGLSGTAQASVIIDIKKYIDSLVSASNSDNLLVEPSKFASATTLTATDNSLLNQFKTTPLTGSIEAGTSTSTSSSTIKSMVSLLSSNTASSMLTEANKLVESILETTTGTSATTITERLASLGFVSPGVLSTEVSVAEQIAGAIASIISGSSNFSTKAQRLSLLVSTVTGTEQTFSTAEKLVARVSGLTGLSDEFSEVSKLVGNTSSLWSIEGTELQTVKLSDMQSLVRTDENTTDVLVQVLKSMTSTLDTDSTLLLDTLKNSAKVTSTASSTYNVTSVKLDKYTGTLEIAAEGTIYTIILGNFEDSNIVAIDLGAIIVKDPNISIGSVVRDNNLSIEVKRK